LSDATDPTVRTSRSPHGPRRLRALIVGVVIATGLAAFLFFGLGKAPTSGSGAVVGVGSVAPNFTLPNVLSSQAHPLPPVSLDTLGVGRRRPVVLNFFAEWCPPCRTETPLLARTAAAEQAMGSPIQFVGVDVADSPSLAIPFIQGAGIRYPVGADRTLRVNSVLYGLNGEPNTFFIDASGHVIEHVFGAVDQNQLDRWMHRLTGSAT
jgi:cytochrome c biogenesis protein CcmG, thiol:disulfide interchange protein DsbE